VPWGYFDGACQADENFCGVGGLSYISNCHYFKFKGNISQGSNNRAKLMVLRNLMKLALERGIFRLQIFGDSLLVVGWMTQKLAIHNVTLQALATQILENKNHYTVFTISHIF